MNEVEAITINDKIDQFEVAMQDCEPIECPLKHEFLPGMYIREIFMPKGKDGKINFVTSLVHNTTHPFVILEGKVAVFSDNDGEQILEAGYRGTTVPKTRRVLRIIEPTRWVTFHPTSIQPKDNSKESIEEAVRLIGEQILDKYENKLLGGHYVNNVFISSEKDILINETV